MENTVLVVLGLLLLGAAFIEIGIIIPRHLKDEVNSQIIANEKIIDGNKYYNQKWLNNTKEDDNAAYQSYYLYNITNTRAVYLGMTPVPLQEIGPLVFRKYYVKFNVTFFDDKVQAKSWNYYVYEQDMSYNSLPLENIIICAPDPIFAVLVAMTRSNATIQAGLAKAFSTVAVPCRTAKDWLLGYSTTFQGIPVKFPGYVDNQTQEQANAAEFSVWNTGIWDQYQLGNMIQHEGAQADTCWAKPQQIHASDNSQFPLGITSDESVLSYLPPIHKVMKWVFNKHSSVNGLSTLRYEFDPAIFQNSTLNPDNAVFYQNGPNGFLNLSACLAPLPQVWVSQSHFYGCDSYYPNQFTPPFTPSSNDSSHIEIEPNTGLPVEIHLGLQQNRYLEVPLGYPYKIKTLFPIYVSTMTTTISKSKANTFSDQLYTTQDIADVIWWVGVVAGTFICFVALLIFIRVQIRHRRRKLLLKRSMRQSSRQRLLIDREARTRRLTAT